MKSKLILFVFSWFWLTSVTAQITITSNDFPAIGNVWVSFSDDRVNVHAITAAGPGQSWNYATAFLINDTTALQFIAPSATPSGWASNFPGATHAIYTPADTIAQFLISQANGFYMDGVYSGAVMNPFPLFDFNPNQLVIPAPFTYLDTRFNTSAITFDYPAAPPVPATRIKLYTLTDFVADAWGSLITPAGNFPSTLRIKQTAVSVDSTFIDLLGTGVYTFVQSGGFTDTTITYTWLRNGTGTLLMTIDQDGTTMITQGADYYVLGPVGLPEQSVNNGIRIFPNPAISFINFDLEEINLVEIKIFNASGQLVRAENVKGINRLKMSTGGFDKGIYFYIITDASGTTVRKGKFVVIK